MNILFIEDILLNICGWFDNPHHMTKLKLVSKFHKQYINENKTLHCIHKNYHYLRFIKYVNGIIIIDDEFLNNYKYHHDDVYLNKFFNSPQTCDIIKGNNYYKNAFNIAKIYDIIYGFHIDSNKKTKCTIHMGNQIDIDIEEGNNYYPFIIMSSSLSYTCLKLSFDDDCINNVTYVGIFLDLFIRRIMLSKPNKVIYNSVTTHYHNGMAMFEVNKN